MRPYLRQVPRTARVVAAGVPHHLTQRGTNCQNRFSRRRRSVSLSPNLGASFRDYGVRLQGYRLMTNHVHRGALPERADSFERALRRADSAYAQKFNRRYRRSRHLWQNRLFSCTLGAGHLLTALAYVDLNPRAGLLGAASGRRRRGAANLGRRRSKRRRASAKRRNCEKRRSLEDHWQRRIRRGVGEAFRPPASPLGSCAQGEE